jgi:hypothetical protein
MTTFNYVPRSATVWEQRAHQNFTGESKAATGSSGFVEKRKEYLRCVTCGHMRCQHCTDFRKRKKWTGIDWRGFTDDEGQIQTCQHVLPDAKPFMCDSAACAVVLGEGESAEFCPCKKFESPNKKKRVPKALPSSAGFGTLIPKADLLAANRLYVKEEALKAKESQLLAAATETDLTALSAKEIAKITGMTQTQVRQVLKKVGITLPRARLEKTEFVTGVNP